MKGMILFIFILLFSLLFTQEYYLDKTNISRLKEFSRQASIEYNQLHDQILEIARDKGWIIKREFADGTVIEIQYLSPSGIPMYYKTTNIVAGQTISTDEVYPGGDAGLNLTGAGITLREWDGGKVRTTHQEFGGRVTIVDTGNTTLSNHSTHVAGTLIAAGIEASAIGMSYEGNLRDFDWNNDESEMASEGALGALISNHSYGFVHGWDWNFFGDDMWYWFGDVNIDPQEDSYFGYYSVYTQDWDQIAYDAPYLLICKAAGNDRTDNGPTPGGEHYVYIDGDWELSTDIRDPDGQYDCIPTKGLAKNILTIGAVNDIFGGYTQVSDVVATTFTSWGPADDGRIKPDIVANGHYLWSSVSTGDSDYSLYSGTSMASPSVAGSIGLLQEHYSETMRTYMLAATAKALVIHTADEAGPDPGPDYMFGWGLMNTQKAAELISNEDTSSHIKENTLSNGETYDLEVYATGNEPLKATICWTDIPGTPVPESLDPPDPMLVNDLDLRITKTGFTGYPWKLDLLNPTNPATNNSDNNIDNLEQVLVTSPEQDIYTVTITHKGTLPGPQDFSLIITGIVVDPPIISVDTQDISVSIPIGSTSDQTIRITNVGFRDLIYNTSVFFNDRNSLNPDLNNLTNMRSLTDLKEIPEKMIFNIPEPLTNPDNELRDRDIEIHHDNAGAGVALGTGGNWWWTCAARFDAVELSAYYDSYYLKQIKIMVGFNGGPVEYSSVVAKVWEGGSFGDPGTLVYSHDITSDCIPGIWVVHDLTSPLLLTSGNEYWLGYDVETPAGFPSTVDDGPVVIDKGDWLDWGSGGNWGSLGWDQNFKIRGVISDSWLNITSNGSGVIAGSFRDYSDLEIQLNTLSYTPGTVKTAELHINSNDPFDPVVTIPVTMTVTDIPPEPPVNIIVTQDGANVTISWDPVTGATSYNIYSDTDPYGSFSTVEVTGHPTTNWSESLTGVRKFYKVTANN